MIKIKISIFFGRNTSSKKWLQWNTIQAESDKILIYPILVAFKEVNS